MSGWRLGYAVSSTRNVELIGKMINTSLSCVPPITQLAGKAALEHDAAERDETMAKFHKKVELLVGELKKVDGVTVLMPAGTFYVFPNVSTICQRLAITSHGLAMYLLEGANDKKASLAWAANASAKAAAASFVLVVPSRTSDWWRRCVFADAVTRVERVRAYLARNQKYKSG